MKHTLLSVALMTALFSTTAAAENKWEKEAKDAWIDGKAEATILFNGNLDSFDINTDVNNGIVTLTGKVDNSIEKELAEELILGIDGVSDVVNRLSVVGTQLEESADVAGSFTDAKISTVITSRLLFDSEVSGTSIDVDVDNKVVTLNGTVASSSERDLAVTIAENTDDVEEVKSMLKVESE
ncbi:BON domain-containing protein [Glaciecola sp. MH2013]|uniref:BON domain-containing protein n=1 Tax=Glaciecola sp. MH2013 TaxID=2785524 RepID=UPI00189EAFC0|nr:BON domain-containing protein [Glaciecola sp. MH2013]MBF7073423.1 BON domain-containing protein [Glaciecola sp. MH2013]